MGGKAPGPLGLSDVVSTKTSGVLSAHQLPGPVGASLRATSGPKFLLAGPAAIAAVAKLLPTSHPISVPTNLGPVNLVPGSVWSGNRMLVYAAPLYVYYTVDDRLYEWTTSNFIREEWLNALSRGAARAGWLIPLAKAEMALLVGILVPWYILLGVSCGKAGLFYAEHKQDVHSAYDRGKRVLGLLQKLRKDHPELFKKVMSKAANDLITHLPEGVTGEDVGFFIGRVIKGVDGLPEITLRAVVKVVLIVAALVSATHLPSVTAHAVQHAAKERAAELQKQLKDAGYTVTPAEAEVILRDALSKPDAEQTFRELEQAARELAPTLEQLNKVLIPTK